MGSEYIKELISKYKSNNSSKLGKTKLVKLLYFIQEYGDFDLGYDFGLYTYGPFDSYILHELDIINNSGDIHIIKPDNGWGYDINVVNNGVYNTIASDIIDSILNKLGGLSAKVLEIRSTLHFINKHDHLCGDELIDRVIDIKPNYVRHEIETEYKAMLGDKMLSCS